MNFYRGSFKEYIFSKENRIWIISTFIIGIIYFIALRFLFPVPSYYSDSFTWVGAAVTGQPITFRPVGYSKMMMFFKLFSNSDLALIIAQYCSNLLANLFLFLTFTYFFSLKKSSKVLLYLLLIANPFYLFYSNYISSDAFFNCFTVVWFTLLIWIMYKPSWLLIVSQLILLACLFELRYNAIFFPAIATIALLLAKMPVSKKIISITADFVLIGVIVLITTYTTQKYTGTKTFSAFSGWQLANNALNVMQHEKIDTLTIKDKEVKNLIAFTTHFFDTTKEIFPDTSASAVFMWHFNSPLKKYMTEYNFPGKNKFYFRTWNALGPVYSKFGKAIILQNPLGYLQHFIIPNTKAYFFPPLEIYDKYMEDRDTIPAIVQKFYHYKSKKCPVSHPTIYAIVFTPMFCLFVGVNVIFIILGLYYVFTRRYKKQVILYNRTLLCFTAFYIANFFFIVLLAPSVFRYHIFILTLSFPVLLYLIQQIIEPERKNVDEALRQVKF